MKIMIAGCSWMVHWSEEGWASALSKDSKTHSANGICFGDTREIFISTQPTTLHVRQGILVHELLHACLIMTGFTNEYWKLLEDDLEEHLCERLENPLASVFRSSPSLAHLLTLEEPEDWPENLVGLD